MPLTCPEIRDTQPTMKTKRPQSFNSPKKVKNREKRERLSSPRD